MLLRAKVRNQSQFQSQSQSSLEMQELVLDYKFTELRVQADVDNAFSLLSAAHNVSTHHMCVSMFVRVYLLFP